MAVRPPTARRRLVHGLVAVSIAATFLCGGLARAGIWDPYELDKSELARRIAVARFGAALALPGARNDLPTLGDLGAGEIGFTSMALGFRLFGLHDWAGRLPLALWATVGALCLWLLLTRLASARAGLYGLCALVTMPLYFMQARTMLGDAATMAAVCLCFAGWVGALLDRSWLARGAWLLVALAGAAAGYLARGAVLGVAAPTAGAAIAFLALLVAGAPGAKRLGALLVGGLAVAVTAAAAIAGAAALARHGGEVDSVRRAIGFAPLAAPPLEATFDLTLRDLGHALFPWSAFLPFAFGRLFAFPADLAAGERERALGLRAALLGGAAACFAAHAALAPWSGALPFVGPALLAGVAGLALCDLDRGPGAGLVGAGTALLALVLLQDLRTMPDKTLSVFAVGVRALPTDVEPERSTLALAALVFALSMLLAWAERPAEGTGLAAWRADLHSRVRRWRAALASLAAVWRGNLAFAFLLLEAMLVGCGIMMLLGRRFGWASVGAIPDQWGYPLLNLWWMLPLALVLVPLGWELCLAARASAGTLLRAPAGAAALLGTLVAGLLLSFGYYAALAEQLSPKEAFAAFHEQRRPGEPLAVLGLRVRTARFYAGGEVEELFGAREAYRWLTETRERRWVVLRSRQLPELNALFRDEQHRHVPVLDARSSQILLASNDLAGARDDNPLARVVLDAPPASIDRPVEARLGDELELLGWDVRDDDGRAVEAVAPGSRYELCFYYRVLRAPLRHWKAFLHIDGQRRRHNGDHEVLEGRYRMTLWRPGDVIADRSELELDRGFSPGEYWVYVGFYQDEERMPVTRGRQRDNRVIAGKLAVR